MKLEDFAATQRTPTAFELLELQANIVPEQPSFAQVRAQDCLLYQGSWLIHVAGGLYYVHAWWYPPVGYSDLGKAEEVLHQWYMEFN